MVTATWLNFQVGAIIVDPLNKKVLGKGWNRMPRGCEDRFAWAKQVDHILKTKYPYGRLYNVM
jgi:deoxycytidylate deaminase